MRTDGRTDMTKLIVAFRNFANAPKIPNFFRLIVLKVSCYFFLTFTDHRPQEQDLNVVRCLGSKLRPFLLSSTGP
jgi:hypothetical protein